MSQLLWSDLICLFCYLQVCATFTTYNLLALLFGLLVAGYRNH